MPVPDGFNARSPRAEACPDPVLKVCGFGLAVLEVLAVVVVAWVLWVPCSLAASRSPTSARPPTAKKPAAAIVGFLGGDRLVASVGATSPSPRFEGRPGNHLHSGSENGTEICGACGALHEEGRHIFGVERFATHHVAPSCVSR